MSMVGRVLAATVAGAALAACGGGDAITKGMESRQAGQGIAVGQPNGGVPVVSEYIKLAQDASCASTRNKLYLVDGKYVLWDRAGECADNAWARTLMGATPQAVLCQSGDSIAGPRTSCTDERVRALFETMLKNLDKADLGLGFGHKVEAVPLPPAAGADIPFAKLAHENHSNISAPRKVVVREAAAWASLWVEHAGKDAALPKVDFTKQMVIGVFLGAQPDGCRSTTIRSVNAGNGTLEVVHVDTVPGPGSACAMAIVNPVHLVTVPRSDAAVEFTQEIDTLK